jgi:hypothetical protein
VLRGSGKLAIAFAVAFLACVGSAQALTLQKVGEFEEPIYVTSDPGNAARLFVVERKGEIELVEGGKSTLFADLRGEVGCGSGCQGERGLASIALAPDFDLNGEVFVDYANDETGEIHVEELDTLSPDFEASDPAGALEPVLEIEHSEQSNHNGGQLQFGPEGSLFVSTGDGGGGNDELHNAQNLERALGKILRVRPEPGGGAPAGNPFSGPGFEPLVWSYGLRNPFRFSFDRETGDMVIGDVGQSAREEVDFAPAPQAGAGFDYGWNCREGLITGPATDPQCATPPPAGFVNPVLDYTHSPDPEAGGASRCAIIGGYVVRDPSLGSLFGRYLYSDNCGGTIRALQLPAAAGGEASGDCWTGLTVPGADSFGEDADGHLYVASVDGGVYRISGQPPSNCPTLPTAQPERATPKAAAPTAIGIRAQRRRVPRGKSAFLTVFVSPCNGRKSQSVTLLRNGHRNGSHYLDRACTARFLPRLHGATTFSASIREEGGYQAAESRLLRIKLAARVRRHRHRRVGG